MKPAFKHQLEGVKAILANPRFYLGDEMRLGKSRQAIDAAQALFERDDVDRAIVIAPGKVARSVWADPDPEAGEIAKYSRVPTDVTFETASKVVSYRNEVPGSRRLEWYVTNYELIRRAERLPNVLAWTGPRSFLIIDEAQGVKSPSSFQTHACFEVARRCSRALLLSGTPNGDNPGDLYAPFKILDPKILDCSNWYNFRAKYAIMGGFRRLQKVKEGGVWKLKRVPVQIVGWTNLEDLYARTAPYILRRRLHEVYDLPPALDPVTIEVPLRSETWSLYRRMKRDALVELSSGRVVSAKQAGAVALRLAQITNGLLGPSGSEEVVGDEKLAAVLDWHEERLAEDPRFRFVAWCRFRRQVEEVSKALRKRVEVGQLYGGQSEEETDAALRLVGPRCEDRAAALVGIPATGGVGLNLAGASTTSYLSNDFSLITRTQSEFRVQGLEQKRPCAYFDFVATGPDGQKTVDHVAVKALRGKDDLANWGAARWARAIEEEDEG